MSLERAVAGSVVVRSAREVARHVRPWLEPISRPLAAADRRLLEWVRGSQVYQWFTADVDPEPVVLDLQSGTIGTGLDTLMTATSNAYAAQMAHEGVIRVIAAPARAFGVVLVAGFGASLLVSLAGDSVTGPVFLFHALGLLVGAAGLREERNFETLAESAVWGPLLAIVAPPHGRHDDEE